MSFTSLLNDEMTIRSVAFSADAYGGQTPSYTTIATARPCRIDTLTNEQRAILNQAGITATHKFFCGSEVTILPGYEVLNSSSVYRVEQVADFGAMDRATHHLTLTTRRFP